MSTPSTRISSALERSRRLRSDFNQFGYDRIDLYYDLTSTQNFGRVYSVELNKYMTAISLDQALKAIQEFVDNNLTTGTSGLVIRVDNSWCSPEVASYSSLSMSQSLGSLSYTSNPDWEEGKYESKFAKKSVTEESSVPFHQRYKVGDKFLVVKDLPSDYQNRFIWNVACGDVLVITATDLEDETMPYQVALEFDKYDCTWNKQFQQLVESGVLVYEPETTETYDTIVLGGVTYNLVPQ
jgi:hypothetical protein